MRTPLLPFTHPATLFATWYGSGLSPKAPGTMGSIAALPFAWTVQGIWGAKGLFVFAIFVFFAGWLATWRYMRGSEAHDPQEVVVDEVSGQALVLSVLPHTLAAYLVGLVLFRLFDIWKPWPVSWADRRCKGAFGVMLDDTLAAGYAALIAMMIGRFL
jgi:phosphatidylglycerophosphatase A